jgi:hypothetical protein
MMKKKGLLISLFVFAWGATLTAQDETQFLIDGPMEVSGFGGPMAELSWVKNRPIYSFGGGGGALFNKQFFLGGYGQGNLVLDPIFTYNNQPVKLEMGHGGLWLGYWLKPESIAHLGVSSRFGWGGIGLVDESNNLLLSDGLFLIQPQLHGELNVLPFMKLSLAAGYRLSLGVNNAYFTATDFNSPTVWFGIYFGWFAD